MVVGKEVETIDHLLRFDLWSWCLGVLLDHRWTVCCLLGYRWEVCCGGRFGHHYQESHCGHYPVQEQGWGRMRLRGRPHAQPQQQRPLQPPLSHDSQDFVLASPPTSVQSTLCGRPDYCR